MLINQYTIHKAEFEIAEERLKLEAERTRVLRMRDEFYQLVHESNSNGPPKDEDLFMLAEQTSQFERRLIELKLLFNQLKQKEREFRNKKDKSRQHYHNLDLDRRIDEFSRDLQRAFREVTDIQQRSSPRKHQRSPRGDLSPPNPN
jgi:hypothetical protein